MKGKVRLGKGLDALINTAVGPVVAPNVQANITEIDVAIIDANPFQPRLDMDETAFSELKKSIKEKGVIQPIAVRHGKDGRFELIAGERRLRAATAVGLKKIPSYVLNITSDQDMLEIALVENVQREHLNPIEQALGYQRLIDECKLTQEDVAEKIGKDRATVANMIRLLKLPKIVQENLKKGEIREGHARALLGLPEKADQIELAKKTIKMGLSVRKVEEEVKRIKNSSHEKVLERAIRKKAPFISRIESSLREKFGTQVKVRTKKEGGSVEITYYSKEDLDRLLELFDNIKA